MSDPQQARLDAATAHLDPPFAIVDLDAYWANARDMLRRAGGRPIRLASKSIRCRALLERTLASDPGFRGTLAFTLPEALWLAGHGMRDAVVAYPTADRAALRALAAREDDAGIAVMVDDAAQLGLIEAAGATRERPVRVCIDVDAGWRPLRGRIHVGAKRSPLHAPAQVAALAREIVARPALRLVGLMAYEAQIAGVGDDPPSALYGRAVRIMQALSARELVLRRGRIVNAVRQVADLEFVNGGGTGSIERTVREKAVTEVAAGSGLFHPRLFDFYRRFTGRPAALFALPVVRRPGPDTVTVLGGGYIASGPPGPARAPQPYLPAGLSYSRDEGAGEVQTPLTGQAAEDLRIGDRVWFRHAKAGELCEHVDTLHLVRGDTVERSVPTYRGEAAPAFL